VSFHDPYIKEIVDDGHTPPGAVGKSVPLTDELLRDSDAVIIVTDHSGMDYARVCQMSSIVIDTRNACARSASPRLEHPAAVAARV
jgi:UDP-N-acetyl-D-glucosamine dehydrogenase